MSTAGFSARQIALLGRSPQYLASELCSILEHDFIGVRAEEAGWHSMCGRCGLHQFEDRTA